MSGAHEAAWLSAGSAGFSLRSNLIATQAEARAPRGQPFASGVLG
jgi:hypothetical protein